MSRDESARSSVDLRRENGDGSIRHMPGLSEEALRQMFDQVDQNGDGSLNLEELNAVLVRSGWKLSDDDFRSAIENLDTDENGRVTFDEFVVWVRKLRV